MRNYVLRAQQWIGAHVASIRRNDVGAVSTETAVITFLLVGVATAVVAAIGLAAASWADNIPGPGG